MSEKRPREESEEKCEAKRAKTQEEEPFPLLSSLQPIDWDPEKKLTSLGAADRREQKKDLDDNDKCVGHLGIKLVETWRSATGTVIHCSKDSFTVLTCAHNVAVCEDDELYRANTIFIQLHNDNTKYKATSFVCHPKYTSGKYDFDLALIKFSGMFPYHVSPVPVAPDFAEGDYTKSKFCISLYGYPGEQEKKGQYWGQTVVGGFAIAKELIYYDLDTSSGQGGAPVMSGNSIWGIHVNYSILTHRNYGVKLTTAKMDWIKSQLLDKDELEIQLKKKDVGIEADPIQ